MHGIIVLNRNGNRRPNTRRRRKKASPFKTITLWILFLLFTLSATIFFLLLVYLDLVTNNKNSRELALCCGAFGVSLLTALRIWVSLPDELTHDPSQPGHRGGHASGHSPGGTREPATCNLYCNCSLQRVSSGRVMQVYHHQQQEDLVDEMYNAMSLVPDNCLSSSSIVNMDPPSYSDCLQVVPSNSNTNINTDISEYLNISDISEGVEEPPPPYSSLKIETTSLVGDDIDGDVPEEYTDDPPGYEDPIRTAVFNSRVTRVKASFTQYKKWEE